MKTISLNKQANGDFVSVPFATSKTAMRLRVEYKEAKRGNKVILESNIDENGDDWVVVAVLAGYGNDDRIIEGTIGGIIPGQKLRVITAGPSRVMYIE